MCSVSELLEKVLLRAGLADSDEKLEKVVSNFLTPVLLKIDSKEIQVKNKVRHEFLMSLMLHVQKFHIHGLVQKKCDLYYTLDIYIYIYIVLSEKQCVTQLGKLFCFKLATSSFDYLL